MMEKYISVDLLYYEMMGYLDVPSILNLGSTSKYYHTTISQFIYKDGSKHIVDWCYHRKIRKQQFFNYIISKMSKHQLVNIGFLQTFFYIEDKFHNTNFATRVLKHRQSQLQQIVRKNQDNDWTFTHQSFYKKCLFEIHLNYENIRLKLKQKYNLSLK